MTNENLNNTSDTRPPLAEPSGSPFDAADGCIDLEEAREMIRKREREITEAMDILRSKLDRDYDKHDSLRTLVVVAVNALDWAKANSRDMRNSSQHCKTDDPQTISD